MKKKKKEKKKKEKTYLVLVEFLQLLSDFCFQKNKQKNDKNNRKQQDNQQLHIFSNYLLLVRVSSFFSFSPSFLLCFLLFPIFLQR